LSKVNKIIVRRGDCSYISGFSGERINQRTSVNRPWTLLSISNRNNIQQANLCPVILCQNQGFT